VVRINMDQINSASAGPLALPLPVDARALAAAQHVLRNPADGVTLEQLARQCGLGARTLERLFRAETGMRFGLWRQKARLLESIRVLVESKSVTHAAFESGYSGVSAYIAAFKQTFGCTPRTVLVNPAAHMPW
jgi:AraC-like DNA-binding protein